MMEVMASQMSAILLGHSGENGAVRVAFDLTAFQKAFPGGQPLLLVRRYADTTAYPAPLTVEGQTAYWMVGAADTARAGYGQCELQWYLEDGTLAKSDLFDFLVLGTLKTDAAPPDAPSRRWFEAIRRQLGDLSKLTTQAKENLVAAINEAAKTGSGSAGSAALRVSEGYIQFRNGDEWENLIAKSELEGTKGEPGEDGETPTIGENGNWYIGPEDTGKPSRGAPGGRCKRCTGVLGGGHLADGASGGDHDRSGRQCLRRKAQVRQAYLRQQAVLLQQCRLRRSILRLHRRGRAVQGWRYDLLQF